MNTESLHASFHNLVQVVAQENLQLPPLLNEHALVFCAWFAQQGYGRLKKKAFFTVLTQALPWYERVVAALQRLQACVQGTSLEQHAALVCSIKQAEALSRRIAQSIWVETLPAFSAPTGPVRVQHLMDACVNMMHYGTLVHVCLEADDHAPLQCLLALVFPECTVAQIGQTYAAALSATKRTPAGQMTLCFD